MRFATPVALVSIALLAAACSSSATSPTATTTAPNPVTDTFSGTLTPGASATYNFTVNTDGTIAITIVSLTPQSTITMGVAIGTPGAGNSGCAVSQTQENVKVGSPVSGPLTAGQYCVILYDLGNITGSDDFTLTVQHP